MKGWKEGKKSERLLVKKYQEIIKIRKEYEALQQEADTKEGARDRMREIVKDQQQAMLYINSAINKWGALSNATYKGVIDAEDLKYIF